MIRSPSRFGSVALGMIRLHSVWFGRLRHGSFTHRRSRLTHRYISFALRLSTPVVYVSLIQSACHSSSDLCTHVHGMLTADARRLIPYMRTRGKEAKPSVNRALSGTTARLVKSLLFINLYGVAIPEGNALERLNSRRKRARSSVTYVLAVGSRRLVCRPTSNDVVTFAVHFPSVSLCRTLRRL